MLRGADLAQGPRTRLTVQLCGDAHLSNVGLFASPERRLVFDVNDFDETSPGPFEWDVKRLGASLEIAGRDNGHSTKQRRAAVTAAVRAYRLSLRELASESNLSVWYAHQPVDPSTPALKTLRSKQSRRSLRSSVGRSYSRDSMAAQRKLTERVNGRLRIISHPPVVVPVRDLDLTAQLGVDPDEWMQGLLRHYVRTLQPERRHLVQQYRVVDVAHKVVGVGSVGARAWIVLLVGADDQDPLLLQAKEAQASVLEHHTKAGRYRNQGRRAVEGLRLIQAYGDILLGWHQTRLAEVPADHYVPQLRDWKGAADVSELDPGGLTFLRRAVRKDARTGSRSRPACDGWSPMIWAPACPFLQAANVHELQAQRLDPFQQPMQAGLVQGPGQHRRGGFHLDFDVGERLPSRRADLPEDTHLILDLRHVYL